MHEKSWLGKGQKPSISIARGPGICHPLLDVCVLGKRVCPFHSPVSDNPHSHPPVETFVMVAAAGETISSVTSELGN